MHHMELSFLLQAAFKAHTDPQEKPWDIWEIHIQGVHPLANNVKKMLPHLALQEVRLWSWPGISTSLHKAPNTKRGRLSQNLGGKDLWICEEGWLGRRTDGKHEDKGRRKEAWHTGIKSDSSLWREKGRCWSGAQPRSPNTGPREQEIPGGAVPAALLSPAFGDYRQHGTSSKVQKTALTSWQVPAFNKSNDLQGCVWDMATHMAGTVSYILPELPPATSLPAQLLSY